MAIFDKYQDDLTSGKKFVLGIQHMFTMFGATVLIPFLLGLNASVTLFLMGVGTLCFHLVTKGKVPVFLGSSFAFVSPILAITATYGILYAHGGLVIVGVIYMVLALVIYVFGVDKVVSFFPPVVVGPIIICIGMGLAPAGVGMSSDNWFLAIVTGIIIVIVALFTKGFFKMIPVMCGLAGGYIVALVTGNVDFAPVGAAAWVGLPPFVFGKFDMGAILIIAPIALVTAVEHIGDIAANSAVTGRKYMADPGLHRTMLGNGIATAISGFFGGPAATTYSENTAVLALTRVYNPVVMRTAACGAIVLGIIPKLGAIISTIPLGVSGGAFFLLCGMIAAVGLRTLVENGVDFKKTRNVFIASIILTIALGGAVIDVGNFHLSSLAIATVVGLILNKAIPDRPEAA